MISRSLFFFAVILIAGCGSGSRIAPVSGKITLDGQPLANAHIAFQPLGSRGKDSPGVGSYAVSDANGAYTLRLADSDKSGAVVGNHRVEIQLKSADSGDGDPHAKSAPTRKTVPEKYNVKSELTCEVPPSGKTDANFELKSK